MAERPAKPVWVPGWHPMDQNMNNNAIWAALDILFPDYPVFTTDLEDAIEAGVGDSVEFEIACETPERGTLTYQWQYKGEEDEDYTDVSGETTDTLEIASWAATDDGEYRCEVVNTYGDYTAMSYSNVCIATTAEA